MATWKNLDTLETFKALSEVKRVKLAEAMSGAEGAERVKKYSVPMAEGFSYNFAAKQVDDEVLNALKALAEEAQLAEKFEELYNGAVINTGENRLVLHQLTRGQLGNAVEADGVDKREFYVKQQARIAEFANKVNYQCRRREVYNGCTDWYRRQRFRTARDVSGTGKLGKEEQYVKDEGAVYQQRRPG